MFCPKCKSEYIAGILKCKTCGVELVNELAKEESNTYEYQELVTVFGPADASAMAIAKSLLEDEGIRYLVKGELLQDLYGLGRFSSGYNQIFGPDLIQVAEEDAEMAKELLKDIIINYEDDPEKKE